MEESRASIEKQIAGEKAAALGRSGRKLQVPGYLWRWMRPKLSR